MPEARVVQRREIARSVLTRHREGLEDGAQNYAQAWSDFVSAVDFDEIEAICKEELKHFEMKASENESELRVTDSKGDRELSWRDLIMEEMVDLKRTEPDVFLNAAPSHKGPGRF